MAQIIVPAQEAIAVLRANLQSAPIIRSMDVTINGPRLGLKVAPILPVMYVVIRFQSYNSPTAQFALEGMPANLNVGALVQLPPGIAIQGGTLAINTDTLLRGQLGLKGLRVTAFGWDGAAYHIQTEAA